MEKVENGDDRELKKSSIYVHLHTNAEMLLVNALTFF